MTPTRASVPFLYYGEVQIRGVRAPSATTRREVSEVHLDELALAAEKAVKESGSMTRDELVKRVRSIFSWGRTTEHIAQRINEAIDRALSAVRIRDDGEKLRWGLDAF